MNRVKWGFLKDNIIKTGDLFCDERENLYILCKIIEDPNEDSLYCCINLESGFNRPGSKLSKTKKEAVAGLNFVGRDLDFIIETY